MANKDLFEGHRYTFNKDGSQLVIVNSSDNSEEVKTFREGLIVSGSGINIKASTSSKGVIGYSHSEADKTYELMSVNDDGYVRLYRNTALAAYLNAGSSINLYIKTGYGTTSTGDIVRIEQSDGIDAFRIKANKDVIVGQSSTHTGRLAFGTASPTSIIQIYDNNVANYGYFHKFSTASAKSYVKNLAVQNNGTDKFFVYSYGKIYAHSTSIASISDSRLKEEIVDANSQWADIKAIEWKNFKMLKDETPGALDEYRQLGVIAQQVETISPGLVSEHPPTTNQIKQNSVFGTLYTSEDQEVIDGEKEVDDVKEVHQNVKDMNYSILWMKSCKALQEAMIKIEQLETRVTALENN